jgi:phage I-like protein
MKNTRNLLILADKINIEGIPEVIQILPRGNVRSRRGPFIVDEIAYKEITKMFKERALDIVIDYEHQTLKDVEAPAAGWIKSLDLDSKGIIAKVEWTEKAKEYLKNKEYRYLSPVILKRKDDSRAVMLHSAGLTNVPAIDGMKPIINSLNNFNKGDDDEMEFLKELAKLLNLAEDATEDQIKAEVKKLLDNGNDDEVVANKEVLDLLELSKDASLEDVKGTIISLKNPAGYVSVEDFKSLQKKIQKKETDDLVSMALSQGKITPAQKEWAEAYALKDPSGFSNFVEKAPQVVPLDELEIAGDKKKETETSINKMLGVSKEDIEKYGKDDE